MDDTKEAKGKRPRDLGKLHALLIKGLPDWVDDKGVLRVYDLAKYCGVSYQAAYKWMERNRISKKRVETFVNLSQTTKNKPEGFVPLNREEFWEFVG